MTSTADAQTPEAPPPAANQGYMIPMGGGASSTAPQPAVQPPPPASPSPPPQQPSDVQGTTIGTPAPILARAEQCLRDKAQRVARIEPSVKLAVDLLLTDVCAVEVDGASLFVRNRDALARYNAVSERGRAGLPSPTVDPETGSIVGPPNVDVSMAQEAADRSPLAIAPGLRALAASLVIEARTPAKTTPTR